jgi:hypothetical protein
MRHVVFDQIRVCPDLADEIGLVAARVEVAMADLCVIFHQKAWSVG